MPDTTPILQLPYILPSQAQKHVTHNEAIRVLDVLVQLAVIARTVSVPPASPVQGDRYIVAASATGAWAGRVGQIALYENGAWQFFVPAEGWTAWVTSEQVLANYTGTAWVSQADAPLTVAQLGISATADATNRLSLSAPATLLNHAGAGHQVKVNKAAVGDTASLLFQTAFSGRAEMGTAGDDDFSIKVSPNGAAFVTGLSIAAASGAVTLPAALRLGGQPSDPVSPPNGTVWLNTTTGEVKMRSAGVSVVVATGGVGLTDGDRGDLTVSSNGTVWTVDAAAISNAKLANMPSATFKGRVAAGSGPAADLTAAEAVSILPVFTAAEKGLAPASSGGTSDFLRADGTWAAPLGGGGGSTLPALGITASAAQLNSAASAFPNALLLGEAANLATGAAEVDNGAFWLQSVIQGGVTVMRSATGFAADGTPWVEYTANGTATSTTGFGLYTHPAPFVSAALGQTFTFGAVISLMSGTVSNGSGVRLNLEAYSTATGGTLLEGGATGLINSSLSSVTQASYTLINAASVGVRALVTLRSGLGAVFANAVYRVSGVQLDRGASRLAYRYMPASPAQARTALSILPAIPAWASVSSTGAIDQGAGIASVAVSGGTCTVTLAAAMSTTTYGVQITPFLGTTAARFATVSARTAAQFRVNFWSNTNVAAASGFTVVLFGA